MANRFPLVLDTTDGNKIKEIPSGDNLDLKNNSIIDVQNIEAKGVINAAAITINGADLEPGTFTDLSDTPTAYQGFGGYAIRIKSDETGIEFFQIGSGDALNVSDLTLGGNINPTQNLTSNIGASNNKFNAIHANYLQGSIKGNDGSTIFDATTNQIPYAVVIGGPTVISDLENDADYITRAELTDGTITVEVKNTGDLVGSVFGDDSTLLVDHLNSRINAARLTRNNANDGQTLVWNQTTQVWEPGTAGDITGFTSNKVDTLTVTAGYKITFADNPGIIEGDSISITPSAGNFVNLGDTRIIGNAITPQVNETSAVGTAGAKFLNGYIKFIYADTVTANVTGNVTGDLSGNVTATSGISSFNNLTVNGSLNATGNLVGTFQGDLRAQDTSTLVNSTTKEYVGNINFDGASGYMRGTTIEITATNRIDQSSTQFDGQIYPITNLSGSVGTLARRWGAGYFDTFSANSLAIDAIEATTVTTQDFNITGSGQGNLESTTDLVFTVGNRLFIEGGPTNLADFDDTAKGLIVPNNGDMIYNTTQNRFQFYMNNGWVDLHKGEFLGNVTTATGESNFNDVVVAGNLTVSGTTTTVDSTNTTIADNVITLNNGEPGAGVTNNTSGIEIDRGSEANVSFVWDDSVDKWTLGSETLVVDTVEANTITASLQLNVDSVAMADGATITSLGTLEVGAGTTLDIVSVAGQINLLPFTKVVIDSPLEIAGSVLIPTASLDVGGAISAPNISGDLKGSVFGDDSSVLVDAVNNKITGDVDATNVTAGNVTVTEDVDITGDITVSGLTYTTQVKSNEQLIINAGPGPINTVQIGTGSNVLIGTIGKNIDFGGPVNFGLNDITVGTVQGNLNGNVTGNVTGNLTGDVTGSLFADDSGMLVDSVAGKIVGNIDITGGQRIDIDTGSNFYITNTDINTYAIQIAYTSELAEAYTTSIGGGTVASAKNLKIRTVAVPSTSIGASGDITGMVAFDATYMYYCTADYDGVADVWKRIAWSVDTW